ncbi:SDR family NAD(P)-dependent oxidoreductase [Pseudonocardia oroxyli]|uniref:SDR family NAD(P)-dependent oxidoreductase n=1 Tax=Pseudonocardia oroxyli TaxID=366584 RepID=UPI000AAB0760|nr:SDR family NAD(P)-dependent oxidoreductase [Pseudonocardia oroxyli]
MLTGGDSGIGRAVAIAFAREGTDVLITHLAAEKADADETARWVRAAGRTAVLVEADLREESVCREVVERAVGELGGLDVLVSNAALPDVAGRRHRRHHLRVVRPGAEDEPLPAVLAGREEARVVRGAGTPGPGRAAGRARPPFSVFLASQESAYRTAEVVGVTGGSPIT